MNTSQVENFTRSAMEPLISATVMIAKVIWKPTTTRAGTPVSSELARPNSSSGEGSRPFIAQYSKGLP